MHFQCFLLILLGTWVVYGSPPSQHFGPNEGVSVVFNLLTGIPSAHKSFTLRIFEVTHAPVITTISPTAPPVPTGSPEYESAFPGPTRSPSKPTKLPTSKQPTLIPTPVPLAPLRVIIKSFTFSPPLISSVRKTNSNNDVQNLAITTETDFTVVISVGADAILTEFPKHETITVTWCFSQNQNNCQGGTQSFTIPVEVRMNSIIVNPTEFIYDINNDEFYSSNSLRPAAIIKLFNVLDFDLNFTVSKDCPEDASRSNQSWIQLGLPSGFIPKHSGAATEIDFSLNMSLSALEANLSDPFLQNPAPILSGCIVIHSQISSNDSDVQEANTAVNIDVSVSRICPAGASSVNGGRDGRQGCTLCPINTYQSQPGQVSCTPCSELSTFSTTLSSGSTSKADCIALTDYFYNPASGQMDICPPWAECNEPGLTLQTLPLKLGTWRTSSKSNDTRDCPLQTRKLCVGGVNATAHSLGELGFANSEFNFNSTGAYCIENHAGAYCVLCIENTARRAGSGGLCQACTPDNLAADQGAVAGIVILIAFLLIMLLLVGSACLAGNREEAIRQRQNTMARASTAEPEDIQSTKRNLLNPKREFHVIVIMRILLGHMQVITIMGKTFQNQLPPFFTSNPLFSFFSLSLADLIPFGCTLPATNHFTTLILATAIPMGFIIAGLIIYPCARRAFPKAEPATAPDGTADLATQTLSWCRICWSYVNPRTRQNFDNRAQAALLFFLFLIYPSTSSTILATLQCDTFDDGSSFLTADYSVQCGTPLYATFRSYSIAMIVLFVTGIPFYFALVIFAPKTVEEFIKATDKRKQMEREGAAKDKIKDELKNLRKDMDKNKALTQSRFLWRPYRAEFFFYEIFELFRKLLQTSVLVLVLPGTPGQVVYLIGVTFAAIAVLATSSPYVDDDHGKVALAAQFSILYIAFGCLLMSVDKQSLFFAPQLVFETTIVAFVFVYVFILMIYIRRSRYKDFELAKGREVTVSVCSTIVKEFWEIGRAIGRGAKLFCRGCFKMFGLNRTAEQLKVSASNVYESRPKSWKEICSLCAGLGRGIVAFFLCIPALLYSVVKNGGTQDGTAMNAPREPDPEEQQPNEGPGLSIIFQREARFVPHKSDRDTQQPAARPTTQNSFIPANGILPIPTRRILHWDLDDDEPSDHFQPVNASEEGTEDMSDLDMDALRRQMRESVVPLQLPEHRLSLANSWSDEQQSVDQDVEDTSTLNDQENDNLLGFEPLAIPNPERNRDLLDSDTDGEFAETVESFIEPDLAQLPNVVEEKLYELNRVEMRPLSFGSTSSCIDEDEAPVADSAPDNNIRVEFEPLSDELRQQIIATSIQMQEKEKQMRESRKLKNRLKKSATDFKNDVKQTARASTKLPSRLKHSVIELKNSAFSAWHGQRMDEAPNMDAEAREGNNLVVVAMSEDVRRILEDSDEEDYEVEEAEEDRRSVSAIIATIQPRRKSAITATIRPRKKSHSASASRMMVAQPDTKYNDAPTTDNQNELGTTVLSDEAISISASVDYEVAEEKGDRKSTYREGSMKIEHIEKKRNAAGTHFFYEMQ